MNNFNPLTCFLVMPVTEEKFWQKLEKLERDQVLPSLILDLEDAVSPKYKEWGRSMVRDRIQRISELMKGGRRRIFLRINEVDSDECHNDLLLLKDMYDNGCKISVVLPKVESRNDIEVFLFRLGFTPSELFVAIESLAGYKNVDEIFNFPIVHYCTIGLEDLTAGMGYCRPLNFYRDEILKKIVVDVAVSAQARNIKCMAPLWPFLNYPELLPSYIDEILCGLSAHMSGMVIFHPYQIEYVKFFWSNQALIDGYRKVVNHRKDRLSDQIAQTSSACAVFDFKMIDMPELKRI